MIFGNLHQLEVAVADLTGKSKTLGRLINTLRMDAEGFADRGNPISTAQEDDIVAALAVAPAKTAFDEAERIFTTAVQEPPVPPTP